MIIKQGQSLPDIALQLSGSLEGMFALGMLLDVALTDTVAGETLPVISALDDEVLAGLASYEVEPATAQDPISIEMPPFQASKGKAQLSADVRNVVRSGQSFIDMALQMCGDLEGMVELAMLNGITLTDDLSVDTEMVAATIVNTEQYRKLSGIYPATANTMRDVDGEISEPALEGIGYWAIDIDFIIQ